MTPIRREVVMEGVGTGLPVGVTGLTFLGVGLQDWVYLATILIALCQLCRYAYLFSKWLDKRKDAKIKATVPPPASP